MLPYTFQSDHKMTLLLPAQNFYSTMYRQLLQSLLTIPVTGTMPDSFHCWGNTSLLCTKLITNSRMYSSTSCLNPFYWSWWIPGTSATFQAFWLVLKTQEWTTNFMIVIKKKKKLCLQSIALIYGYRIPTEQTAYTYNLERKEAE
jgi:hypothetical protein